MTALEAREAGTDRESDAGQRQWQDLVCWLGIVAVGLAITVWAVASGARLGTDAAPFLGVYRIQLSPWAVAAPLVAIAVLWTSATARAARWRWRTVLGLSWLASFGWMTALALMQGPTGLTAYLSDRDGYRPDIAGLDSLGELVRALADTDSPHSGSVTGHPPGTVAALWALHSLPLPTWAIGLIWTALSAAAIPLILTVARSACGPAAARRFAPLIVLAPFAIWAAVGPDGLTTTIAAAALTAADRASRAARRGWPATGWAVSAGLLLALATMFAYLVAWLGLSMMLLYFARRRPGHNLVSGLAALVPLGVAQLCGFDWAQGLTAAYDGYLSRIETERSMGWWLVLCAVVLTVACGPALVAGARKVRNTPAWPFLVGAAAAVVFSAVVGVARGGVEETWLPLFPWLMIAATAPAVPGGRPQPAPLLLAGGGAVAGIALQAVLVSPW